MVTLRNDLVFSVYESVTSTETLDKTYQCLRTYTNMAANCSPFSPNLEF